MIGAMATVVAGAAAAVTARRRRHPGHGTEDVDRWHSVTVDCTPEELGSKPPPLDSLGFPVEIRIRPAPGERGTELAVRAADPAPDRDTVRHLRRALREARSLAEVGEVLLPDTPATTRHTLTGAPLAYATRHGREEGRL
jgi:hypothetical protein